LRSKDEGQWSEFVDEKGGWGAMNGDEFGVVVEEEKVGGGGNFLILLTNLFFLIPTLIP